CQQRGHPEPVSRQRQRCSKAHTRAQCRHGFKPGWYTSWRFEFCKSAREPTSRPDPESTRKSARFRKRRCTPVTVANRSCKADCRTDCRSKGGTSGPRAGPKDRNELNEAIQLIKSDADLYKGIGFTPLRVQQVKDFFSSLTPDKNLKHPWDGWIQARKHDI